MGEFNLQESFDTMRQAVSDTRQSLVEGRIVTADRQLDALYDQMTRVYQALDTLARQPHATRV